MKYSTLSQPLGWLPGNTASLALELCKCTVFELGWVLAVSANSSQNSK